MKDRFLQFLIILSFFSLLFGNIIFVDADAGGSDNGTNWTDAFTSFQSALDAAVCGDSIWVAAGTYYPSSGYDVCDNSGDSTRYYHFRMIEGVAIFGGFAGTEDPESFDLDNRDFTANETILSGDIGTPDDSTDNCYHVFYHNDIGLTHAAILDGFTLCEGNADNQDLPKFRNGGGILNWISCSPTISNTIIRDNSATNGGGINNYYYSSPVLVNVCISNNSSSNYGGGMMNDNNASPSLTNVTIDHNSGITGGGISNFIACSPVIINSIIADNSASYGGGINNLASSPVLTNVTISNNYASTYGGGMRNTTYSTTASMPVLNNCIIWGNTATNNGNEIYISDGTTTLNYSCYGNESNDIYNSGTFTPDDSCLTSNPRFVNNNAYDYRLLGVSPCVNTGNNTYNSSSIDIRGEDRIQNTTIDMGAYEWTDGTDPQYLLIYVDADATGGDNDGDSWANAYTSLQSALDRALSEDEIWVATGTYYPSSGYDVCDDSGDSTRYYHFRMIEGVAIYGGFAGTEDPEGFDLDDRDFITNETILSGDIGTPDDNSDNCYHVFFHYYIGLTNAAILDGFTICDGNANANSPHCNGGGIYINHCLATINNVIICQNYAQYGGGICNLNLSSPLLTNIICNQNSADRGGGMYNSNRSSPVLTSVSIDDNNSADRGGGMYNDWLCSPQLTNVTISNNSTENGGGMYNDWSSPALTDVIINDNNSTNFGGGIYNDGSSPSLINVTINNNSAEIGGGIYNESSSPHLTNVIISNNSVNSGGGIFNNEKSSSSLTNVTITNNSAENGDGWFDAYFENAGGSEYMFSENTGGGIYNENQSTLFLKNCVIWGNTSYAIDEIWNFGDEITMNYSCYSNGPADIAGDLSSDANCITSDPCFAGAENNPDHPYSIGSTSPCIDAGYNDYCSETYDIRGEGYPRKLVGSTGEEGGTIDMGAYEYNLGSEVPTPVTLTAFTAVAKNGAVQLDWETASEINNAKFIIYRNDVSIGSIDGAGTTSEPQHYTFTDNAVVPEVNYTYVLADVDYANTETRYEGLAVTVTAVNDLLPGEFRLGDAYPNPFNPLTVLPLLLGSEESVKAVLYDCRGNKVRELQNGILPRGKHELCINGNELATGLYFVQVKMNDITQIKKIVLIK